MRVFWGLAAFGPARLWLVWVDIRFLWCCGWRFRPYGESPFPNAEKVTEKACSYVRPLAGSGFLRSGTDPGAAATVCFAAPPSAVYDCVVRSLRSHARINPSTQPSDVAGGSKARSKALELALIVEWCGFAAGRCAALRLLCRRACSRRRPDSRPVLEVVRDPTVGAAEGCDLLILLFCGSEPARDDGGTFKCFERYIAIASRLTPTRFFVSTVHPSSALNLCRAVFSTG